MRSDASVASGAHVAPPRVEGFVLTEPIHRGARTLVFRGVEESTGRRVVVKVHRDAFPTERELASQRRALALARRADAHPWVVDHLGVVPSGHDLALVMEDFGGVSLDRWMRGGGRMAVRDAVEVAVGVAEGLARLHASGIVHKDVKPANIVLSEDRSRVSLIDLGIASVLRSEVADGDRAEGTLRYVAPEQTGRMNRPVDARADLYALGVTLFETLAGRPPFESTDPLELVHAHIARMPPAVVDLRPEVPDALGAIVARLLEKNAEDRYQSAHGVRHDLQRLLAALDAGEASPRFPLGEEDLDDRFSLPDRLYGRDAALGTLLDAFDRVCAGDVALQLVAGASGVGKSALVAEVQRPIVTAHARYASGKFDLYRRDLPYLAWVGVVRELVRESLTLAEDQLAVLRRTLEEALGGNGAVIADVAPEVALLIGEQPAPPEVASGEARARFVHAFRRFLGAFTEEDRPLVVFLDDLQWADLPSLDLLEELIADPDGAHLLVLGAYRDHEVGPSHPLRATLKQLATVGRPANLLELPALEADDVCALVADTLRCSLEHAAPLADVVYARSGGNPFYARQLLVALHRDGLVRFDAEAGRWTWSMERVRTEGVTDDVGALVARRLAALPDDAQAVLRTASCLGATFDLDTLATVRGGPVSETAKALEHALAEGLVVPLDAAYRYAVVEAELAEERGERSRLAVRYRFLHDRIEEAAHDSLDEDARAGLHLRIGRLLQARAGDDLDEHVIDIASHLCEALPRLTDPGERLDGARLCLRAARRAKASMAVEPARRYLADGLSLLPDDPWTADYVTTLGLRTESADVAYIEGRWEDCEGHVASVLARAREVLERVPAHRIRIGVGVSQAQYVRATHLSVDVLRDEFGESLPKDPSMLAVVAGLVRMKWAVGRRSPDDLLALPRMTDEEAKAALGILMKAATNAYWGVPNLVPLIAFLMIRLSLRYGNDGLSAYGYALYGMIASAALGLVEEGYAYGRVAMELLDRTGDAHLLGKTGLLWHGFIRHHRERYRDCAAELLVCYHQAMDAGDVENAVYCGTVAYYADLLSGRALGWVEDRYDDYLPALLGSGQEQTIYALRVWLQAVDQLASREEPSSLLQGRYIDFEPRLDAMLEAGEAQAIGQGTSAAGWLAFVLGDTERAERHLTLLDDHRDDSPGQMFLPWCQGLLAILRIRAGRGGVRTWRLQRTVAGRAARNREDFGALLEWIEAEREHVAGRIEAAAWAYEAVATEAHAVGNLWMEGLVLERLAGLYGEAGQSGLARHALDRARGAWRRHGSWAKLRLLGDAHAVETDDLDPSVTLGTLASTTSGDTLAALDVRALLEAVRAVSSEIELDRLVARVLQVALRAAGARHGLLVVRESRGPRLAPLAEARVDGDDVAVAVGDALVGLDLPTAMLGYVQRTRQVLRVDDATADELFARDPWVHAHHTRSVLCMPLLSQGELLGVLYLESDLGVGVFTEGHVGVLETIAGQAAVALQNARLFDAQREAAEAFARFVPRPFLEHLGRRRIEEVALGDAVEADVSVLFSDLRGFTALSEQLSVSGNFELINSYLARMQPAVKAHGGFIDKFIGDAVMALFVEDADSAVHAAVAMHRGLATLNAERAASGLPPLAMGVGVHTGSAMLGTIGSPERLETTVIGDTVNLASRIEGQTKPLHAPLVVSEATAMALRAPDALALREVGMVRVKGRQAPVRMIEVLDARPDADRAALLATRERFEAALDHWVHGRFEAARDGFQACATEAPVDRLADDLARRADEHLRAGAPADWDGVEERLDK